jgi:hypothetical protein
MLRCRLRSALTHLEVRSLSVLDGALPRAAGDGRDPESAVGPMPRCRLRSA